MHSKTVDRPQLAKIAIAAAQLQDYSARMSQDERHDWDLMLKYRERRALAAYRRSPHSYTPPDEITHLEREGMDYVVLSDEDAGTLAVYRIRNDGQLKRMKRPPNFREGTRRHKAFSP